MAEMGVETEAGMVEEMVAVATVAVETADRTALVG